MSDSICSSSSNVLTVCCATDKVTTSSMLALIIGLCLLDSVRMTQQGQALIPVCIISSLICKSPFQQYLGFHLCSWCCHWRWSTFQMQQCLTYVHYSPKALRSLAVTRLFTVDCYHTANGIDKLPYVTGWPMPIMKTSCSYFASISSAVCMPFKSMHVLGHDVQVASVWKPFMLWTTRFKIGSMRCGSIFM